MSGRSSQRKGAGGERELRDLLRAEGFDTRRGGSLSFGTVPDVIGLPGVHIECKRVERLNVSEALRQSIRDSKAMQDGVPTLFHRRNREPWLVTLRMEDWMPLYRAWLENQNGKPR